MVKGTKLYTVSGLSVLEMTFVKMFNGRYYFRLEDGSEKSYREWRIRNFKASRILLLRELRDKLEDRLGEIKNEISSHEHRFKHL